MDEDRIEVVVEGLMEKIEEHANNSTLYSQEESAAIYEGVQRGCRDWANTIRSEMD